MMAASVEPVGWNANGSENASDGGGLRKAGYARRSLLSLRFTRQLRSLRIVLCLRWITTRRASSAAFCCSKFQNLLPDSESG